MNFLQRFIHGINSVISSLQKAWSFLKRKIDIFFHPIYPFSLIEQEVTQLLQPREKVVKLSKKIFFGTSAQNFFENLAWQVEQEKISNKSRGQASLILSRIYEEGINTSDFAVNKNQTLSYHYLQKAKSLLGENTKLEKKAEKYLMMLKKGGESPSAFEILVNLSKNGSDKNSFIWANKLLSDINLQGIQKSNFKLPPNANLAKYHEDLAKEGVLAFDHQVEKIVKKLLSLGNNRKIKPLMERLADSDNPFAQYHYARLLEAEGHKELAFAYYEKSAQGHSGGKLRYKTKGNISAKIYMVNRGQKEQLNEERIHYIYQIAKCFNYSPNPAFNRVKAYAEQGNLTAKLQSALLLVRNTNEEDIAKAEEFFSEVYNNVSNTLTPYCFKLFEKLALQLAQHYENLFLMFKHTESSSLNQESLACIEKIIHFLKAIPIESKRYQEVSFRVTNFQQYFLKQEKEAFETLYNSNQNDFQTTRYLAWLGFKSYWEMRKKQFNETEKQIILNYEAGHPAYINNLSTFEAQGNPALNIGLQNIFKNMLEKVTAFYQRENNYSENIALVKKINDVYTQIEKKVSQPQAFFSQNNNNKIHLLENKKALLESLYYMLPNYKNADEISAQRYFKILQNIYYEFFVKLCEFILKAKVEIKETNYHLLKKGV